MLKQGIILGLLCVAGHAYSGNIVVTTTDDNDSESTKCSLRHAIEYVNQGMPETAYKGCGGSDATNVIQLTGNSTYTLNKEILITKDVTVKTTYDTTTTSTNTILGQNNAIIKMAGTDRLFTIDRKGIDPTVSTTADASSSSTSSATTDSSANTNISVMFSEVSFQGCGQGNCVANDQTTDSAGISKTGKGGLIYNKETLSIQYAQIQGGYAAQGGVVYNAGQYLVNTALSSVSITNSLIQKNQATQGAIIFSEIPQYAVSTSVIRDNTVTDATSALFDVGATYDQTTSNNMSASGITRGVWNATIFNNTGHVAKVVDALWLNNVTVVGNTAGVLVNAPYNNGYVINSILVQNGSADCEVQSTGLSADNLANNLYSAGCAGTQGTALGTTKLFAGTTIEGACDINSDGILCPFSTYPSYLLGYFRPRLIATYSKISDSPIVNQGPNPANTNLKACQSADQRGKSRPVNSPQLCDRGAIELIVDSSSITTVGQDITYGQTASFTISDQLSDGDLLTPTQCQSLYGDNPTGQVWQPGCAKIVQTNTESKGTTTVNQDGTIKYVPNGNWHGADEFDLQVISTTTRFNDSKSPYITIPVNIVQAPTNDFENKSVKTSGGAIGIGALGILLGLVGLRRYKAKR